jgi:excisionase family DNA binding protein
LKGFNLAEIKASEPREPLLTVRDAATLLHVSPSFLYVLVETKAVPHLRIGRAIRFDRHALLAHMQEEVDR